jgi:hypothetical protein
VTAEVRAWLRRLDETHGEILRGDDDMRRLVREHDAVPALVAALTAVLDLADELELTAHDEEASRAVAMWEAADRIRAAVAAPLAGHDNEEDGR